MSLKDRLASAKPRTATHRLRIEDDATPRADLAAAQASGDQEKIAVAREALDACYETIALSAIPPDDWEALIGEHPPTKDRRAQGAWCDPVTFLPAALAACVQDQDEELTEADWADYTRRGAMTPGEVVDLYDDVVALHDRSPQLSLGKD